MEREALHHHPLGWTNHTKGVYSVCGPDLAVTIPGPPGKAGHLAMRDFFLPQLNLCILHTGEVTMMCLFKHQQRNSVTNTVTTESRISEGEQVPEGPMGH